MSAVGKTSVLQAQYEAWPYPQVPLLASLPSTHPFELHCDWLWDRSGSGPAPERPRVWIAGCGTFEPYVFALANPKAEILASDFSRRSLELAARRCRWHGQRQLQFAPVDLSDPGAFPDGPFDLIECYGVLMNLPDPQATLRALQQRLSPRGVLRLMVYPYWSRARVFQIQRVARLLGLSPQQRHHPALLRQLMRRLPKQHPLRYAFCSYRDSRNDAGVVDGFLHQGDRGFTGYQLGRLLQDSGLTPAYWFHRPWGQPDLMAARLELPTPAQSSVLHYLDLWQELRGNYVVCARRADAPPREPAGAPRPHPQFADGAGGWRHRLSVQRLQWLGGRLPARTESGPLRVRPQEFRELRDPQHCARQADSALVLGAKDHGPRLPAHAEFAAEADFHAHCAALRVGRRAPNPLYAHLFAAFELSQRHPELGLRDIEGQMGRWLPWADPLEERPIAFGLTPYATWQRFRTNLQEHLARATLPAAADYGALRLRGDREALAAVRGFLADVPGLPSAALPDAALRELYVLLLSHDSLFLTTQ